MNIKAKEIRRSLRDFENICRDLTNANWENYLSLVKRLMMFVEENRIIKQIIDPLFYIDINASEYLFNRSNGWSELIIPSDKKIHIALTFQLFKRFITEKNFDLTSFILNIYRQTRIQDNLYPFNSQLVEPALREIITIIEDYIEDEVEGKEEIDLFGINLFSIGSIVNQNGNIAIGTNINIDQTLDVNRLPEEFAKLMLSEGYSLKQLDQVRMEIEDLKNELIKPTPSDSKLKTVFKKVFDVGGQILVDLLLKLVSKPEITTYISHWIKNN